MSHFLSKICCCILMKSIELSHQLCLESQENVCKHVKLGIETYNNMARYNLIDTKYRQMVFRSLSDGAPISPYQWSFGTPGQTKVSGDHQRETTHEVCFSAAESFFKKDFNSLCWAKLSREEETETGDSDRKSAKDSWTDMVRPNAFVPKLFHI